MQEEFFKDLKVVELASVLAGPAVGMFFAELGAKVIKVENKTTGGDVTRKWRLPNEDKARNYSAYYCSINWHKEVLMLNIGAEKDYEILLKHLKEADIIISNFKEKSARKLKVDYETIKKLNPKTIYAQLHAFGKGNKRLGFDVVLQAETAYLSMTGEPDRAPVKMPVALIDQLAAHQLKEAILMALLKRAKTGQGSYVETSLLAAAISSLANQATNWLMEKYIPKPMGTQHPNIAPYGDIFITKDQKQLVLAIGTNKQFTLLCECIHAKELAIDERFNNNEIRVQNRDLLVQLLKPFIEQFTLTELMNAFLAKGIPAGQIRNMQEVFGQEEVQNMILEEAFSDGTMTRRVKTVAFNIGE